MKIALGVNFYNCVTELQRLVDSIPAIGFIDHLIAIDGVYRYHKEKNSDLPLCSEDGSLEVLFDAADQGKFNLILMGKSNTIEHDKRNAYLEICERSNIDVLIIVDSDEFFIYPEATAPEDAFTLFKQNIEKTIRKHKDHNVFSIRALNMNTYPPYDCAYPRIWYKPGEMRYLNGSHYYYGNIYREAKDIETFNRQRFNYVQYSAAMIKGVVLAHSHDLRTGEYMTQREEYIEYLKRFEGLTQSHYFTLDQSHKLAMLGVNRDQINLKNKDEILQKYNLTG